jgi:hypothetical protein
VANGSNRTETNGSNVKAMAKQRPEEWTPEANKALLRVFEKMKVIVRIGKCTKRTAVLIVPLLLTWLCDYYLYKESQDNFKHIRP